MRPAYVTRCPICGCQLIAVDEYGDYNVMVKRDGKMVRKSENRWFDPDWIIERHIRVSH
jgi:hypothetical protein